MDVFGEGRADETIRSNTNRRRKEIALLRAGARIGHIAQGEWRYAADEESPRPDPGFMDDE
jgi:hypothetical protein